MHMPHHIVTAPFQNLDHALTPHAPAWMWRTASLRLAAEHPATLIATGPPLVAVAALAAGDVPTAAAAAAVLAVLWLAGVLVGAGPCRSASED